MSGDVHAGFCERRGVRLPPATHRVVLVAGSRADAEALREQAAAVLAPMGLRLSDEKTRIAHIDEGFEFLGWHIQSLSLARVGVRTKDSRQQNAHCGVEELVRIEPANHGSAHETQLGTLGG